VFVNFNILNQLGSPAINSNTFANRPAAGQTGRLFVSTDTFEIYRDNGTTWDLIGGPGTSTITGTGTATQVAYFTSSQAIGSSANLYWDNTNTRLGIGTSSPGVRLDVHGTGVMMHINATSATANSLMSIQRTGTNVWRIGDNYNSGDNFFELRNSVLSNDALTIQATTNKAAFLAQQTYSTGQAQGALFTYNLTAPAGTTFATPNALSAVNAFLNLSLGGNATLPAGTRQGIEGNSRVSFTGAGTLTMSQGSTLRAYAAITGVHSFAGSAVGTITHLAGIRLCFPDNIGSAINITNNYGLLINDQSAGTGTITYTNRWGIYQEGASDLNYFASNLLIGSTVNNGAALQVTGNGNLSGNFGIGTTSPITNLNIQSNNNNADIGQFIINGSTNTLKKVSFGYNTTSNYGFISVYTALVGYDPLALQPNGGNVGIGTTTPTYKLHVYDGSVNGDIALFESNITKADIFLKDANTTLGQVRLRSESNAIQFIAGGSIRQTITSSGNVGINTTTPTVFSGYTTLSVNNSSQGGIFEVQCNGVSALRMAASSVDCALWEPRNVPLYFSTNNTIRQVITGGGNVLIGTTTDAGQKLQVNGNGYFNSSSGGVGVILNAFAGAGDILFNNAGTQKWNLTSVITSYDLRLYNNGGINDFALTIKHSTGNAEFYSSIKTGAPTSGTAAAWKLGSRVAATVVVNTTEYIEVDIGGTLYKLATVT